MPTDLFQRNTLIIKRILSRSSFSENQKSDTSCYSLRLHIHCGGYPESFDELLGNNSFTYGEPRFLGAAEKVDIKDYG